MPFEWTTCSSKQIKNNTNLMKNDMKVIIFISFDGPAKFN